MWMEGTTVRATEPHPIESRPYGRSSALPFVLATRVAGHLLRRFPSRYASE